MSKKHKEHKVVEEQQPEVEQVEEVKVETPDYEAEALQWKDKYLRIMAEFDNFRKRSNAEKADWIRLATQKLALEICDVADNLERALAQGSADELATPFGKGVQMIEKQLVSALEKEGVKKISALGEEFNPEFHEALAHIPSEMQENMVAAVIQNGYLMHDKVLRPARVAVSNGTGFTNEKMTTLEE